jgi:hypothetical protein
LRELDATFPHIIRALENGLLEAREYFDSKGLNFDGAVFSAIVRLHARQYLNDHKLDAEDLQVEQVSLCGLWLKVGRYHVKIWKISSDDLARALQRQASSGEQLTLVDENGIPIVEDLAMYWTDDGARQLGRLHLVQPRIDDPRCFDWIWSREISLIPGDAGSVETEDIPIEYAGHEEESSS